MPMQIGMQDHGHGHGHAMQYLCTVEADFGMLTTGVLLAAGVH